MTVQLENPTAQRFNSISWHDSKLTGLCFYKAGEEEKVAKRFDSTAGRDPLSAIRKILLDYIAYAEENPFEYRILFMSIETLGELELTREDLQERNPAFGPLFKLVEACIKVGVLQGNPFTVTTVLWTGAHGAAALLITATKFPFASREWS